ncbi:hypothetical protein SEA_LASTRESORT_47 [Gordonia phage LastResort]|uniref:Uncharacterized protein n=2 Tax=Soupsvirus soups TaxID=1982563 RepID=A0A160DGQ2_9CAUD|nr:hypothetical protein BEN62_gp061 [Gordonia phage KatherineG]YP_009269346.1 hypothetical protein BEN59_gp063 [Gordonia phage Soups]ASZ73925.1 hypothetical protein SEA_SHAYRA_49 [Gordonia phage ShayRa]AXH47845.1 hypothetical protein SEA_LASTRESORT_47 [Gordonia phage LastResort]QDM56223.1 hypothetical protein SEA_REMO_47 [Gordonia phage ReMo]QZD98696.1 hypothetical protein SEA_LOOPER_48 [Gordonia phage Looper]UAJ15539.1 hypothetical protein SEA_BOOHOO_48 [Gordonia Phage Boohoo]UVD39794.1 hyp
MTVKETLTAAKELLKTEGWAKGDLIKGDGCLCALGAVGLATGHEAAIRGDDYDIFDEDPKASAAVKALVDQIPEKTLKKLWLDTSNPDYSFIHEFNDAPDTAEEDVLALFDKAIQAQGE